MPCGMRHTTPAHDRQGPALTGRYARQFGPRLLTGYSQLTYTHLYTYIYIYIYTYVYMCV